MYALKRTLSDRRSGKSRRKVISTSVFLQRAGEKATAKSKVTERKTKRLGENQQVVKREVAGFEDSKVFIGRLKNVHNNQIRIRSYLYTFFL